MICLPTLASDWNDVKDFLDTVFSIFEYILGKTFNFINKEKQFKLLLVQDIFLNQIFSNL